MICLSLDTTTDIASIALTDDTKLLAEYSFSHHRDLSCRLIPNIKTMLKDCKLEMHDIRAIGVSTGPGSFTGLRIGVVTAKTLAQVLDVPVAGISSLDLLALQFAYLPDAVVCPIIKVRKGEVYYALFRTNGSSLERISEYAANPVETLVEDIHNAVSGKVIFCGDGLLDNAEAIQSAMGHDAVIPSSWLSYPKGYLLACEAVRLIQAGLGSNAYTLMPFYIRKSTPEIRLEEALRERLRADGVPSGS
ncbi:MAG: tRNA (adenosine(37)-N6)-threonylcarbamoyltransferase complex dimerization subunit type 1 TsaB [Armatimonadota bacterium]